MLMTSCKKENSERILGSWVSTEESFWENYLPEGAICFTFRADDSVEVADISKEDHKLTGTNPYFLSNDTLIIEDYGRFEIRQLKHNHMNLIHPSYYCMDDQLFFKRKK